MVCVWFLSNVENEPTAFTFMQPMRAKSGRETEPLVFFLLKCLVCIALVIVALQWRGPEGPTSAQAPAEARGRVAAPKPPRRPQIEESARDLAQAGGDALIAAARDRCLASPRDCAAALQRLQGQGR